MRVNIEFMDNIFIDKLREGDKDTWATLFKSHIEELYEYGTSILEEEGVIKGIIQELFLFLYERKESLLSIEYLSIFLNSSLRWRVFDYSKSRGKEYEEQETIEIEMVYIEALLEAEMQIFGQ